MKVKLVLSQFLFCTALAFGQLNVRAEFETLGQIALGAGENSVAYQETQERSESPGSPIVDSSGDIVFYKTLNEKRFLILKKSEIESYPYSGNLDRDYSLGSFRLSSQQGISFDEGTQFIFQDKNLFEYSIDQKNVVLDGEGFQSYPAPFGALIYSDKEKSGVAIVLDIKRPSEDFTVIDQEHLKHWLKDQPGQFKIGDDGHLYRGSILWSAVRPTDSGVGERFVGRLMSGHLVWTGVIRRQERYLVISTPQRTTELIVEIPWGGKTEQPIYMYDSGLGPWGELYCLLPPDFVPTRESRTADGQRYQVYEPDPKGQAQLVVVRNYLKYFGRLNDGGVRLRKTPSTTGEIVGTYPIKTGFRILQKGDKEESIGGQKNVWYQVRLLDGTEGWFFGAFVQNLYDGPNGKPPPWPNVPDW